MAEPMRQLRLHLGAHKTATTHLQDTLAHHREALLARGADYLPCEAFRPLAHRYSRAGTWRMRAWPLMKGRFDRQFEALRRGPGRVLVSDEDLLGYAYDLLAAPLYARPKALHVIRHLAGRAETAVFLGIRSFDSLLPSAYAQTLKAVPPPPGGMARIRAELARSPPSWAELADRLAAALPGASLRIWRQEDYRRDWRQILDLYAGCPLGPLAELPPPALTRSPSASAVAEAEALDPALPRAERIARVRAIYAARPAGPEHGSYAPLSLAETDRLRTRYEEDLEVIRHRHPGMLVETGQSGSP
ncbi:hypothetical protein [Poseidonocella sp. HB161398]|uniref:hypothetical protein n=1 Tax=Poseidonocella sp. HB161398 TaxID=2320855 RepID=UPI00110838BA|nr:hypothetical protein [Poseidonocella sp. HB161398]